MHRLRRLVRLHREGESIRAICRQLRMGRNTARSYRDALGAAGLLEGDAGDLPELHHLKAAVAEQVGNDPPEQQVSSVQRWATDIQRMVDVGAGPKAIFDLLSNEKEEFDGSYDAVKRFCRRLKKQRPPSETDVAIPVITQPGEVAQVDFFYVGRVLEPASGRLRKCWAFVMVLAHSRHMFVELVFDQRIETWLAVHVQAFAFFRAVPRVIVPDNLKAAVIKAAFDSTGEVALNRSYVELAQYYGFRIDPTPVRAPKKKGRVERMVTYVRGNYLAPRAGRDVLELRAGLTDWLLEVAGQRIHGTTGHAPLDVFEAEDLPAMLPCPALPFGTVVWHHAKVHADSHLQFRKHLYSVPWAHLNKLVWVRADNETLIVLVDDERVATHRRVDQPGRSTLPGHLPPAREQWGQQSRLYWEELAATLGSDVLTYVMELFECPDALLPLRKVQAIVTFLQDYPEERREAACRRARFFGVTRVRAFKDILRKGLDQEPLPNALVKLCGQLETPRFARPPSLLAMTPEA